MTSHLKMSFGMATVRKEFVTMEQLVTAMTIQVREDANGSLTGQLALSWPTWLT